MARRSRPHRHGHDSHRPRHRVRLLAAGCARGVGSEIRENHRGCRLCERQRPGGPQRRLVVGGSTTGRLARRNPHRLYQQPQPHAEHYGQAHYPRRDQHPTHPARQCQGPVVEQRRQDAVLHRVPQQASRHLPDQRRPGVDSAPDQQRQRQRLLRCAH